MSSDQSFLRFLGSTCVKATRKHFGEIDPMAQTKQNDGYAILKCLEPKSNY